MTTTTDKLNRLADLQTQTDVIRMHFDELRSAILTPEIRKQLADIYAEQQSALDALQAGIAQLTEEIKTDVLALGGTVKADHLQAVWVRGRVSWDAQALEGYSAAHPEITPFRKVGEPSVLFRRV